ncbi:MAG: hypothetical protein ACMG6E_07785 [Candidatus Roizmanbacteria bacterium]
MNRANLKLRSQNERIEAERREDAELLRYFGVPNDRETIIVDREATYGFAYSTRATKGRWQISEGSFEFLYGMYLFMINNREDEQEDSVEGDDDQAPGALPIHRDYVNCVFFQIFGNKPGAIIYSAAIEAKDTIYVGQNGDADHRMVLRDLIVTENLEAAEPFRYEF